MIFFSLSVGKCISYYFHLWKLYNKRFSNFRKELQFIIGKIKWFSISFSRLRAFWNEEHYLKKIFTFGRNRHDLFRNLSKLFLRKFQRVHRNGYWLRKFFVNVWILFLLVIKKLILKFVEKLLLVPSMYSCCHWSKFRKWTIFFLYLSFYDP